MHRGHQWRQHGTRYDSQNRLWSYGHSGESYWDDGWILEYHIYNCHF